MAHEEVRARPWRVTVFRVLAALIGIAYLPGGLLLAAPWIPSSVVTALPPLSPLVSAWAQAAQPDTQRWTFALSAVVDVAIAVILLALAWRPLAQPLLAQFLALALVVDVVANVLFDPEVLVAYATLLLLLVAYPEPRRLLTPFWRGPIDRPLGAMAIVVGVAFAPGVWQAWQAQVAAADPVALSYGWASIVEHLCNLWLIAVLAATRKGGSTLLAFLVAACLCYLGVAAIAVPDNPGSWGLVGGAVALVGGAAYLATAARARRP